MAFPSLYISEWWDSGHVTDYLAAEQKMGRLSHEFIVKVAQMQENNPYDVIAAASDFDFAVVQKLYVDWTRRYEAIIAQIDDDHRITDFAFPVNLFDSIDEYTPGEVFLNARFIENPWDTRYGTRKFDDEYRMYTYLTYDHTLKKGDIVTVPVKSGGKIRPALAEIINVLGEKVSETEYEIEEVFCRTTKDSYQEFEALTEMMDYPLRGPVLCIAQYSNWKRPGPSVGVRISQSTSAKSAFRQLPEPFEQHWYIDSTGDLICWAKHPCGENHYTFRELDKGYSAVDLKSYIPELWDPKTSEIDAWTWMRINAVTKRIGPVVAESETIQYAGPLPKNADTGYVHRTLE